MKVNIVTNMNEGWIMPKYARVLEAGLGATIGPYDKTKHNIFLPYYNMNRPETPKLDPNRQGLWISYFTHFEVHPSYGHRRIEWAKAAGQSDIRVFMSNKYRNLTLEKFNVKVRDEDKYVVIHLPVLESQVGKLAPRKVKLGISSRDYPTDRKGRRRLEAIQNHPVLKNYVEIFKTNGKIEKDSMMDWYHGLDYYVVLSTVEGGPMGLIEAGICNVPTIGPLNVGFCDLYADRVYEDTAGLLDLLTDLCVPKIEADLFSEETWIKNIKELIRKHG